LWTWFGLITTTVRPAARRASTNWPGAVAGGSRWSAPVRPGRRDRGAGGDPLRPRYHRWSPGRRCVACRALSMVSTLWTLQVPARLKPRDHREGKPALLDGDDDADGIHVLRHRRRAEPRGLTSRRGARHAVVTMFSGGGALRDLSGGRGAVPRRRPRLRQEIDKSGPAGCCTVERLWRGTVEPDARRGAGR
jgi:hypothetical protein